jgi:integrase
MSSTDNVGDLVKQFYDYLILRGREHITAYNSARHVQHFLEWVGKTPKELSRDDIIEYLKYLRESKKYSDLTLKNVSYSISSFLDFIGMKDLSVWVPRPVGRAKEIEWLPEDVVMKVVGNDPILRVAYELALRVSELLMLRRSEYDSSTGNIVVYREKHKGKPNKYLLKLSDETRKLLNEYLMTSKCPDDRIFCISRRAIQGRFKRALKRAGLDPKKYTFHILRHSRCTNICINMIKERKNVDLITLAKFMGHLNPQTTMQYIHIATRVLGTETPIEIPSPKLE